MISQTDLVECFEAAEQNYRFLSQALFKELTEEAIGEMAKADYPSGTGNAHLDRGYALIRRYFAFSSTDRRTQLACEYARIFLAAGVYTKEKRTAIPYESVHTGEERIMMGEARDDVVRVFLRDGFKVDPSLHEPEDHLAFELEYLAEMNRRAARMAEERNAGELKDNAARQVAFIDSHLLNWVPALREIAEGYAKVPFYIGILLAAQGSLEQSRTFLDEVSAQLSGETAA